MKQQEVHGLAKKLLQADEVVHEQQLGWQWQGPDEEALLAGPHSPQASKGLQGSKKKSRTQQGNPVEGTEDGETTEGEHMELQKTGKEQDQNRVIENSIGKESMQ